MFKSFVALCGSAYAATYQIPTIEWNQTKLESAVADWEDYANRASKAIQDDNVKTASDLLHAFTTFGAQVAVARNKVAQPWLKLIARAYQESAPDARCNVDDLADCFYKQINMEGTLYDVDYNHDGKVDYRTRHFNGYTCRKEHHCLTKLE